MRLQGKNAIVTGAARGIGAAIAQLFASEGARVIIADILQEEGEIVAARIRKEGGESFFVPTDVSQEDQVAQMITTTCQRFGSIDILCNNAGILHPDDSSVLDLSWEVWQRVIDVDLGGSFLCSKHALRQMVRQKRGGSIIMIASIAAIIGCSKLYSQDAYTAAKGGLVSLARSIATQFGKPYGIRCNAILPGPVVTTLNKHLFVSEEGRELRLAPLALPRLGMPVDIAQAALFLADDAASGFLTGQSFIIDGGATSRLY